MSPLAKRPLATVPMVRSAVLTNYVAIARNAGLDPYQLVKSSGLSAACLSDPEMKVPAAAVRQLLEDSARLSGVENFGLRMAENRRLSTMGLVGAVTRDARSLREALEVMTRFMKAHNESLFLELEETGEYASIRDELIWDGAIEVGFSQSIELSIGALVRIIRVLLGDEWAPERVYFAHPAARDQSLHASFFRCPVIFGHEFNGLTCHRRDLDRQIASSDPVMARYAQTQLEQLVHYQKKSAVREIQQIAMILLPSGRCTIENIARQLCVDRRTVNRQLAREGARYPEVINQMRGELSDRYLENQDRTMAEIAILLGFSGPSAYSKWHNARFGHSPSKRRIALLAASQTHRSAQPSAA